MWTICLHEVNCRSLIQCVQTEHIDSVRVTADLDLTFCQATVKSGNEEHTPRTVEDVKEMLTKHSNGEIQRTIQNCITILQNDHVLADLQQQQLQAGVQPCHSGNATSPSAGLHAGGRAGWHDLRLFGGLHG